MSDFSQGPGWWLASDGKWYPPQPAQVPPASVANPLACWLVVGGSVAVIIGAFLPWATVEFLGSSFNKSGTDGDGILTLIGCAVSGAFGVALLLGSSKRGFAIAALVLAALVLAIGVIDTADVSRLGTEDGSVTVGIGLWLTDVGAIVALAGCVLWLRRKPSVA